MTPRRDPTVTPVYICYDCKSSIDLDEGGLICDGSPFCSACARKRINGADVPKVEPVMQTKFGYPEGNCIMACVASITGFVIESLPDLYIDAEQQGKNWWRFFVEEMMKLGYFAVRYDFGDDGPPVIPMGLAIVGGSSPRKIEDEDGGAVGHVVVMDGGKLVHDPHPDQSGIGTIDDWIVLIPVEPLTNAKEAAGDNL